ncbi:GM23181 [Drosophila sechellia]|uniref:GM23181 n=1 Tax=Drosophila sechellia TaxID=7238 RepID=B4IMQ5_DROSE|nr:GM23181 [Drosophila sechellia]
MKVFIVFAALAALSVASAAGLTDSQKAEAKQRAKACAKQEGITKEQACVKCFANCFLEQSGLVANGQIKPDVVLAKLGPIAGEANVKEVQAKCDSTKGADKCDTSYLLYKCYYENRAQI